MKSKYNSLAEWSKYDWKGYLTARNGELIPKICETFGWELPKENKPNGYWTLELCKEEALNYQSRTEWQKNSKASYQAARKKNWLNEASPHMKPMNPKGYWTKERCQEEALKYNSRTEWYKNNKSSYSYARKYGWYYECTVHMVWKSNPKGHWTLETCKAEALKFTTRIDWKNQSQGSYEFARQQIWYSECTAHMLSKIKSSGYWTKERCLEEALKHKRIVDWAKKGNSTSISVAKNNGWFDECTSHMTVRKTKYGYWNKETCLKEAIKYTSRTEWSSSASDSYIAAKRRGIVEECCVNMIIDKVELEWTKERCIEEALKYKTRKEWRENSIISYNISNRKNGWIDECTAHMSEAKKPNDYWTLERCIEEALKYKTRKEWRENSGGSFCRANKNGWVETCCGHMMMKTKPMGYWTKEHCIENAKLYKNATEWNKADCSAYQSAHKNGWYEECTPHFNRKKIFKYWENKEKCIEEALKYNTRTEWQKNSFTSNKYARKNGWLEECTKHMEK